MHDPYSVLFRIGRLVIWHRDKGGVDGGCIHFMRAHHGDGEILKRITARISYDWKEMFPGDAYDYSVQGIYLNWMSIAAWEHFKHNRKRTDNYLRKHLADIMLFAENPVDSARSLIINRYNARAEDRRVQAAQIVYGMLLRDTRPWWKDIKFHLHHWRFSWEGKAALPRKIIQKLKLGIN